MFNNPIPRCAKKYPKWKRFFIRLGILRVIPDHLNKAKAYLERWYILGRRKHKFLTIAIHKVLRSDSDDLHDHPFPFIAIRLAGGYWERTLRGVFWRGPGSIGFSGCDSFHSLKLQDNKPSWSLFIMGPRLRDWGFLVNGRWVDHLTHLYGKKKAVAMRRRGVDA